MAKRGNPNLDQVRVKFSASDDWGEALADKPTQVKLPKSMKDYVDSQPDRGAWLRRAVAAAIEAEQHGGGAPLPLPSSPPTAPTAAHRFSKAELEAMPVVKIKTILAGLKAAGVKVRTGSGTRQALIDRILEAQG